MRMAPIVVGEIEDGAESDVSFMFTQFFYSIVDTPGVDWEKEGNGVNERCIAESRERDRSTKPKGNYDHRACQVCRWRSMSDQPVFLCIQMGATDLRGT